MKNIVNIEFESNDIIEVDVSGFGDFPTLYINNHLTMEMNWNQIDELIENLCELKKMYEEKKNDSKCQIKDNDNDELPF